MLPPRFPPIRRCKIRNKTQFNPSQQSVKYKEWMSAEILQLIKDKEKAYSIWKKSKGTPAEVESLRLKYRAISNIYTTKKRTAKRQLEESLPRPTTADTADTADIIVTNGSKTEFVITEKVEDDDLANIELDPNAELIVDKQSETENKLNNSIQASISI